MTTRQAPSAPRVGPKKLRNRRTSSIEIEAVKRLALVS